MRLTERIHDAYGASRRVRVLAEHFSEIIPPGASVLDVGCGDGEVAQAISGKRADLSFSGLEVLERDDVAIPVQLFDGRELPHPDDSFDVVLFVDVLHHSEDPLRLLREASRVARRALVIKDHRCNGFLAEATLRFMDDVGNARFGVSMTYDYWSHERWHEVFRELGLAVELWRQDLGLYPVPATWFFDRSLHFVARLGAPG